MERAKWPALSGLILGTILLTRTAPTSFAYDKIVHTGIAALACAGIAVFYLSAWLPDEGGRSHKGDRYEAVPMNEVGHPHASREPSPCPQDDVTCASSSRKLRILFLVLVAALVLRVEVLREVFRNIQCSSSISWELMLPILFALWDWWTFQRKRRRTFDDDDDTEASAYEALEQALVQSPFTYPALVALTTIGETLALSWTRNPSSTFICSSVLSYRWIVPVLQFVAAALDAAIIFCLAHILLSHGVLGSRSSAVRAASIAKAMLASASILLGVGIVYFAVQENDRRWILTIPTQYFWDAGKLSLYFAFTSACAVFLVLHIGVLTTLLVATFTSATMTATISAWENGHPFPPQRIGFAYFGICLAVVGLMTFFHFQSLDHRINNTKNNLFDQVPVIFYLGIMVLLVTWTGILASSKIEVNYHPIDLLIFEAQRHHEMYRNQSSASTTLQDAVSNYESRYGRLPPPNFDKWFEYATQRNSNIIDDFDSINRDLLPFQELDPAVLRERTWQLIANSWNDAAGITIRDGKVSLMPNVPGTHQWMSDGLVKMISEFSEWLPDMDLAFNINDEARVAVPSEEKGMWGERGVLVEPKPNENWFSPGRAEQWRAIDEEPADSSPLQEISWQQTFHRFGNVACHGDSLAVAQRHWDWSKLCLSCTYPQSLGAFLANWTIAGDICHQPDLADLHGFYTSPAAFKGTHELYPIFSQSKPSGFNDILYPSAWNYINKAKYEPSDEFPDKTFAEKEATLFWRGATSEGVSNGRGQWRGMTRQRFVHLANDIQDSAPPQAILLPSSSDTLRYRNVPVRELKDLLPTDVRVVDNIARCAAEDCGTQAKEFAPMAEPINFQQHWRYKYLLDLDGAGFSGRFLPFLQSRSLPFKAALVREWWDDRVTPWLHFVPLDLRGQGFWATLAYFHGIRGRLGGKEIVMAAHARDAGRIAESGRKWANEALRKEDMEIYMFRLLLEWGRLTDDRRAMVGFDGS